VNFRLLGRLEVDADGVDLTPVRPKQRALLALLLLRAGEVVATDELVEALWGPRPPETAQKALHGHISALRKRLEAERIETRPPGYRLVLAGGDELDLDCFERVVATARTDGPSARSRKLRAALALFRGEPLSDFRYEEFAAAEAARLEELRLTVVEEQIEAELELGRHAEVVPQLERLVVDHPLRERMRAQLMLALYRAGRQADPLQAFQEARTWLVDELGIEPGPALQRLERQILNQEAELAVPDALSPERNLASARANLPPQPTPLIGREREIEEVTDLLRRPEVRLVTLTGTGGTGKTRLAIQAAAALVDNFADGVVFVGLAPLQDPDLVLTTAAQALGVIGMSGETLAEDLARRLRDREPLLVFDNFEHLLAAAPSVADLAAGAAGVKLLVTSRAPLHLSAEHVYPVSPLATPTGAEDVDRLLQYESVALFEARAQAARPDFAVTSANAGAVADVCRALDGLPLAIELAASRVGALPPAAMRRRLDHRLKLLVGGAQDAPERQRTLRATIDWSYELLEQAEQRLLVRLVVFAGGCTIEAAQTVCGDDFEAVDGLAALTEKGLTRLEGSDEEPRFTMLETIREYAAERLERSEEASTLHRRHAEHFLALAEEAEPNLIGVGSHADWLDRLERDHDNFRAALDWLEASGDTGGALRLTAALWRFWDLKGHLIDGRRHLERAIRADERPTAARAKALSGAADMALTCGDVGTGRLLAEEALKLYRTLGDDWGTAFSLLMFAYAVGQDGDWPRAQELFGESVQRFRVLGDDHYELRAARAHAWSFYEGGDLDRSRELYEDILPRARATHHEFVEAIALSILADIAVDEGRVADAVSLLKEGHRILCEINDLLLIAAVVGRFASALAITGRAAIATQVLSCSAALMEEIGAQPPWFAKISRKTLAVIHAQLDDAAFAKAWEQGRRGHSARPRLARSCRRLSRVWSVDPQSRAA
jgi:predicted ATPase/DNA-binding SARP family transcriptional activator